MVFVQRANETIGWTTLADLQSRKVLFTEEATHDINNLQKVIHHRIDLFPIEESVGRYLIARDIKLADQDKLMVPTRAFWLVPIHLVIAKKHPHAQALMASFDAGYNDLLQNKRIQALERKLVKLSPQ